MIILFLALPLPPLKANATFVEATVVVISWHRSPEDNGKIAYALDCFRCKSPHCKKACDRQVRYLPGKENITGVNVTVHGLSSSSFFLFRVYSVSELNQQEKDKNRWNYAEVFVETKGDVECEWQNSSAFGQLMRHKTGHELNKYQAPPCIDICETK